MHFHKWWIIVVIVTVMCIDELKGLEQQQNNPKQKIVTDVLF